MRVVATWTRNFKYFSHFQDPVMIYLNLRNCQQYQDHHCFPHIIMRWSSVLQFYSSFLCIYLTFKVSLLLFPIWKIHKTNIDKISIYHKRVPETQIYSNSSASRQGWSPGPSQTAQVDRGSLGLLAITSGWEEGRKDSPLNSYSQEIPRAKYLALKKP